MEDLNVLVQVRKVISVMEETARSMEVGVTGHLGQIVEVIVRCQDLEVVTILLLLMEDLNVLVKVKKIKLVLEEYVKSMEAGQVGHLGLVVEVTVKC